MNIFKKIIDALHAEERVMLATILNTAGSTPAAALAKMLLYNNGSSFIGTIGGGCMEGEVQFLLQRWYEENRAGIISYELNEDDVENGLICGGNLEILIEPLTTKYIPLFEEIYTRRINGEDTILVTHLSAENNNRTEKFIAHQHGDCSMRYANEILRALKKNETVQVHPDEGTFIFEPVAGTPHLYVFGGGHVSKFICRIAAMAGFRVTVIDDRMQYANSERFPDAQNTIVADYAELAAHISIQPTYYVVIVTRGHQFDETILEQVLSTNAKYIGMIGSTRKVLITFNHLLARGITREQLLRVYSPVGLELGAVSAEEIAVSIVAELIRCRRGEGLPMRHKNTVLRELGF